jgi:predicted TIM-barrel fold metal-dependent hydrolase
MLVGACGVIRRPLKPLCTEPVAVNALTIDVHAHMFNGTDLPVQSYLELVAAHNLQPYGGLVSAFGPILRLTAWGVAPNAQAERAALKRLSEVGQCPADASLAQIQDAREQAYRNARKELQRAAAQRQVARGPRSPLLLLEQEDVGYDIVSTLPQTYVEFRGGGAPTAASGARFLALRKTAGSVIDFVVEMFQYRYTSFARYLEDFERASGRRVDLTLSALVDYDWWLNSGRPTETSLREQVDLMADLAVTTGGRLHYWAPFCPYRQAQWRLDPRSTFSSLKLVQDAVREHGAIGVKIYPPMGFAPYGNATLSAATWRSASWLSGLARSDSFGKELDRSMDELFAWCVAEDVAILAHANTSSGPSDAFEALAGPDYWEKALDKYGQLRVIFGHFGGAEDDLSAAKARHFIQLMGSPGAGSGIHASADVSYFEKAMDNPSGLETSLRSLMGRASDPTGILEQRLLFGSDWKMLLLEAHADQYLKDFTEVFTNLAQNPPAGVDLSTLVADGLGRNALSAVGLLTHGASRDRLSTFYAKRGVPIPRWMTLA